MNIISKQYNFTLVADKDPNGDWGAIPKSGAWTDPNATFGGVFGSLVDRRYDISVVEWKRTLERRIWVDFTNSLLPHRSVIMTNAITADFDASLFTRPFTRQSWIAILISCAVMFACLVLPYNVLRPRTQAGEESLSGKCASFSSWSFFLLINAFYGGALTMFFSSEPRPPFETTREGLGLYPDWQMIMFFGNEINIQSLAEAGDPAYKEYWDLVRSENGKHLVASSMQEALEKLVQPGRFIIGTEDYLVSAVVNNPIPGWCTLTSYIGTTPFISANIFLRT